MPVVNQPYYDPSLGWIVDDFGNHIPVSSLPYELQLQFANMNDALGRAPGDPWYGRPAAPEGFEGDWNADPRSAPDPTLLPNRVQTANAAPSTPAAGAATGGTTGGGASGGNQPEVTDITNQAQVDAWIAWASGQPGADPTLKSDPAYWRGKIMSGTFGTDKSYWLQKATRPVGTGPSEFGGVNGGGTYTPVGEFNFPSFGGVNIQPYETYNSPQGNFSFGAYNAPQSYTPNTINAPVVANPNRINAPQIGNPATITAPQLSTPRDFAYTGNAVPDAASVGAPPDPGRFDYGALATPELYKAMQPFAAPNLDETNDPGYEFRRKEGLRALQNAYSAQGVRGGDVAKALEDYAQNYASGEYEKVYGRAQSEWLNELQNQLAAYQTNVGTQMAAQGQQFGQANTAYSTNRQALADQYSQALALYNAKLSAQQQQYGQEFNTAQFNTATRMATEQANAGMSLDAQKTNVANWLQKEAANAGFQLTAEQANQQAQQAVDFANAQFNYNAQVQNESNNAQASQNNITNALNSYLTNYNTSIGAFNANNANAYQWAALNSANTTAANSTNMAAAFGAYDRNYQNAWNAYQAKIQENQYAAGNAYQWAGLNLAASGQEFNNSLQGYYAGLAGNNQQYNQIYNQQQLGLQAAGLYGNTAGNYGNAMTGLYGAYGNAGAAGAAASAGAYGGLLGNAAAYGLYGLYNGGRNPASSRPTGPGVPNNGVLP